jgi:hypothetical protein
MTETVYILCTLTSLLCAVLLFWGYRRSNARMLLWCAICFAGLSGNNIFLFLDKITFPNVDLLACRTVLALASLIVMIYGLIFDAD